MQNLTHVNELLGWVREKDEPSSLYLFVYFMFYMLLLFLLIFVSITGKLFLFFLSFFPPKALRVSMEEQRQRQEDEARRAAVASAAEAGISSPTADG